MHARDVQGLLTHMEWADGLMWVSVIGLGSADREPRLRERLHHLHSVQWAYLQIWRGEPMQIPDVSSFDDLRSLLGWAQAYYRELPVWLATLDDAVLDRPVQFPWAEHIAKQYGSAGPVTLGESALQVALHTAYHRGQMATRIRELGGEPPLTDYVAWLWMARPAPRWDIASRADTHPT
jgi:uncharacterized damage-inducible protein DinB